MSDCFPPVWLSGHFRCYFQAVSHSDVPEHLHTSVCLCACLSVHHYMHPVCLTASSDSPVKTGKIINSRGSFSEEICTLVIAEAFPEDGGQFSCTASNQYGSIHSAANLTVTAGESSTIVEANVCQRRLSNGLQPAKIPNKSVFNAAETVGVQINVIWLINQGWSH